MFNYSKEAEFYIDSRRKKVIEKNNELIENIRELTNLFGKSEITKELTYKYIDAVERSANEIYMRPSSTISLVSNIRFLFETCITARLLVADESYKYKVKYSIYNHQLEKSKNLTQYAKEDMKLLETLEKKEKEVLSQSVKSYLEKPSEINDFSQRTNSLYEDLDEEIGIFLDNAEYNGAGFQKHWIEIYLEKHQNRENTIAKEWENVKKSLLVGECSKLFNFCNQTSKIEKELKDTRSWQKKADDVNLGKMYSFLYDYTSALIHSTSYSILVPNQLDESEIIMILSLASRLSSDILKNLKKFSGIPNMMVINTD